MKRSPFVRLRWIIPFLRRREIERTVRELQPIQPFYVIEGDQATTNDSLRIKAAGVALRSWIHHRDDIVASCRHRSRIGARQIWSDRLAHSQTS